MATFSRHASQDKPSQPIGPRQANGTMQSHSSLQQHNHLHQPYQPGPKSFSSHSHHPSSTNNTAALNTELRAQARREREATREKSKDMLLTGQTGRERSSSIISNQQHGAEPKGASKTINGGDNRTHLPRLTAPRHAHKTSTSAGSEYSSQQKTSTRPLLQHAHAPLDRRSFEEMTSQRQPFSDLASRIPSPPKGNDNKDDDSMQTAYFVKSYYDIVEKCHSWQRYASNLKTKAETLELENRILRDINAEQDGDIQQLKMEMSNLKQATMVYEHERRRAESKLSCYSQRLSPVDSSGDLSSRYVRLATNNTNLNAEGTLEPITIPSPPTSNGLLDASGRLAVSMTHPYCSSNLNLLGSDNGELTRPPTPTSANSLPHSLQAVLQGEGDGPYSRSTRHRNENSTNDNMSQQDIIKQDLSYEYDCFHDTQMQGLARGGASYIMTASNTFPPAGNTPSAALTVQALAAMNRQVQDHSLQTSISVPKLPSQVWDHPLSPNRVAKRQVSAGQYGLVPSKQKTAAESDEEADKENANVTHLTLPGYNQESVNTLGSAESRDMEINSMVRGGSSQSDAATVTGGDYLQDIVEQRRRLRKVSQSQQLQLQYLQARTHLLSNASQGSVHSAQGGTGSRPSSRLSNYGGMRGKARSRAGSYSLHDAIPVVKDDVFGSSDALSLAPIKRAGTMPLASIDVNIQKNQSGIVDEWMTKDVVVVKDKPIQPEPIEDTDAVIDSDPKGAHRRLYIRMRNELETADLVRFERYVHRYDALEIGVEGSRGIINRVRRLLLPEELVHSKLSLPDKYRLRKELAREFERIVREDAIPRGGENQQEVTTHSNMIHDNENNYA